MKHISTIELTRRDILGTPRDNTGHRRLVQPPQSRPQDSLDEPPVQQLRRPQSSKCKHDLGTNVDEHHERDESDVAAEVAV